ncbi:hypothetical protein TNCT_9311 [Trichonephila clavata]|uniref:Uncharacterized protein n=1 Tax=Trichonephila clavata TaxID=2740835 RepID=A0A8X6FDR1_TRICU|nr:hypothetical protein TNCT_9311 [Trichonephila clavata]
MKLNILDRRVQENYPTISNSHCMGTEYAFITGNLPAFEYFFGKLSAVEKKIYFKTFFDCLVLSEPSSSNDAYTCDIIYYLLSQMNENQRTSIFEEHAYNILKCLLEFPYLGLFLEIESIVQKYLTADQTEALAGHKLYQETSKYFVFRRFSSDNAQLNF